MMREKCIAENMRDTAPIGAFVVFRAAASRNGHAVGRHLALFGGEIVCASIVGPVG